jgi:hypothetical protein
LNEEQDSKSFDLLKDNEMARFMRLPFLKSIYWKLFNRAYHDFYQRYTADIGNFDLRASDIYLISYPKSGNTWVSILLANVLASITHTKRRIDLWSVHDFIPELGDRNPYYLQQLSSPRFIKSHETYPDWSKRIHNSTGGKYIQPRVVYILRDGRDSLISYYHHLVNIVGWRGGEDELVDYLKQQNQDWAEHVNGWYDMVSGDKRRFLLVKYEDLKLKTSFVLREILSFAGLEASDDVIEKAVINASFESMKKTAEMYGDPVVYSNTQFNFMRKGETGSYKSEFSDLSKKYYSNNKATFLKFGYGE